MAKYKIVISDYYYPDIHEELEEFRRLGDDVEVVDCTKIRPGGIKDPTELLTYAHDCDALITQFAAPIDAAFMDGLEKCRVIARYAIGLDTVDLAAAKKRGIMVANCTDYCLDEVADSTAAHILNAARRISVSRDRLMDGNFEMNGLRPMLRLENSTICFVGFGNIARNLYRKMRAFFGHVVAVDPYITDRLMYPDVEFLELHEALSCADVVTMHLQLTPATRGIIGEQEFQSMKPVVIFVNTARGGLVDEAALMRALDSGRISYCALDVLGTENFSESPLLHRENVILTPHISWCSEAALAELQKKTAQNVVETFLHGEPIYRAV